MAVHDDGLSDDELRMLTNYLAGESTPAELAAVTRWIEAAPGRREAVASLREAIEIAAKITVPSWDVDSALRTAEHARAARRQPPAPVAAVARDGRRRIAGADGIRPGVRRIGALAAAILVVAAGVGMAWRTGWFAHAEQVREFASAAGSRVTVTLRDGTTLVLGPATRLRVPRTFGTDARAVELDGEAVFTVVHDALRPFVVRTARGAVRDVGTTFAVRAYVVDRDALVAVAEGAVALGATSLRVHDVATIDSAGGITVRRGVSVTRYFDWARGRLVFEDTPLSAVVRELERTYDVRITIADSTLDAKLVSATFPEPQAPIDDVLRTVTYVVGAHYERVGSAVVIRRGTIPAARSGTSYRAPLITAALTASP